MESHGRVPSTVDSSTDGRQPSIDCERPCRVNSATLVTLIETMPTPVMIDQVVDAVVQERANPCPSKSWHDVHEELYLVELPALDATDRISFDGQRGLVDEA